MKQEDYISSGVDDERSHATRATKSDLKAIAKAIRIDMTHLERRLINKIYTIVIGTASVMMFLDKFLK